MKRLFFLNLALFIYVAGLLCSIGVGYGLGYNGDSGFINYSLSLSITTL